MFKSLSLIHFNLHFYNTCLFLLLHSDLLYSKVHLFFFFYHCMCTSLVRVLLWKYSNQQIEMGPHVFVKACYCTCRKELGKMFVAFHLLNSFTFPFKSSQGNDCFWLALVVFLWHNSKMLVLFNQPVIITVYLFCFYSVFGHQMSHNYPILDVVRRM